MRLGPVVHGGLLLVALGVSYQTSTRQKSKVSKRGTHPVWKLGPLSAVVFETKNKRVRIEERRDENGSYYWGEIKSSNPTKTPAQDKNSIREFPVGVAGEELMVQYQSLLALRNLGPIAAESLERYNLHENTSSFTAIERGKGERSLVIAGEKIYGGTDRYMLDVESGTGYVLSGKFIQPLISAESSLGIKSVHSYDPKKVKSIAISTTTGDTVLIRDSSPKNAGAAIAWAYEQTPESPDEALGGFVERVAKLKTTRYHTTMDPESLLHIATLRYRDDSKASLGYLELYRQLPSAQAGDDVEKGPRQTQYFIKTERTRVLAKVARIGADRVDQDLVEVFGIAPAPAPVRPGKVAPTPSPAPAPSAPGAPATTGETSTPAAAPAQTPTPSAAPGP